MAVVTKARSPWWSRLHFLVRFAGVTGLLAAGVGAALAFREGALNDETFSSVGRVRAILTGTAGTELVRVAVSLIVSGAAAAVLALALEVLGVLFFAAGRRSAFGFNAALQVVLAGVLLVGLNYYSFHHYRRADWTSNHQFTLPADLQAQLRQLRGETTIVAYQRHKTFGQLNDKPDAYDYAAERKVVEKVKDLVDQFREFGPQFRVIVLDVEEEGYNKKLTDLSEKNRGLREAIEAAPENSIFFVANDEGKPLSKVQRLSFNEFYQLDKAASKKADDGRGNLVLLSQGVEPFARKVLNIDERPPRVGVLVIHEWLTTVGPEDFGLAGFKKALTERGYDVRDIILKKWSEIAPAPEAAVYTYDESKFERLEEQLAELDADIKNLDDEIKDLTQVADLWKTASLDDLTKRYAKQLGGRRVDEALRQRQLAYFQQNLMIVRAVVGQYRDERQATLNEKVGLNVENIAEQRRISDLKAKLDRSLADCDMLFIPRMTIRNVILGDRIPNRIYRLDDAQVDAIKDFMKAGKPVFACFGPSNEHPSDGLRLAQLGPAGPDQLEKLFEQLGVKFGNQTILFNSESKAFAERRSGLLVTTAAAEVPPVEFTPLPRSAVEQKDAREARRANPIRESMRLAAGSLGKNLDLRVHYPRPVYYAPPAGAKEPGVEPEFLLTSAASWNDDQPFPSRERTPRFEPAKPDDPAKGTLDEKRRGPFPIGVAVETAVPTSWYGSEPGSLHTVRVAALGSGSVFTGQELSPAKEQLLLNTCNWLLGRDDLLPKADRVWEYPRVHLSASDHALWRWGAWLALPGLFAYAGLVVLMIRRVR